MSYRELLIGCGFARDKRIKPPGTERFLGWCDLKTLDNNPACKPDYLCDLGQEPFLCGVTKSDNTLAWYAAHKTVIEQNSFNEIHAYEVLEHIGRQGDVATFMYQFREFWRWLKPGGYLCATVPAHDSLWAWGDPSHTRIINAGTLVFLSKKEYEKQIGRTAMSDFRNLMGEMDFDVVRARTVGQTFEFILRAIKNPHAELCDWANGLQPDSPDAPDKCDGDHGGPACKDPDCWHNEPP